MEKLKKIFMTWAFENGRYIGLCGILSETLPSYMPNIKSYLASISARLLLPYITLNVETEFGKTVDFAYDKEIDGMRHTGKPSDYAYDMGLSALYEIRGDGMGIDVSDAFNLLTTAAQHAQYFTLYVLKESLRADERQLLSTLREYLVSVLASEKLIEVMLLSATNPNQLVFIPDATLSAQESKMPIHLEEMNFDSQTEVPFFSELVLVSFPNEDGSLDEGEGEVLFKKGHFYNVTKSGTYIIEYYEDQARQIVERICF